MKYLKVFTDFAESMDGLSDAEKGRLFVAMLQYAESGEAPDLRGGERILWPVAKQMIDRELESYEKLSERNRKNAASRYQSQPVAACGCDTQQDKDKDKILTKEKPPKGGKEKGKPFSRPTVADITEYCRESGITIDADAFVDFYASKGWKIGDSSMKDWKAAVRNWARRDAERSPKHRKRMGADAEYKQTMLDDKELDALLIDLDSEII